MTKNIQFPRASNHTKLAMPCHTWARTFPHVMMQKKKKCSLMSASKTNFRKKNYHPSPLPPQNLLDCVAMGKINTRDNLETVYTYLNASARTAPTKLFKKAANISAPKSNLEISNFGGKNPPQTPSQSAARSNFSMASKSADWIVP